MGNLWKVRGPDFWRAQDRVLEKIFSCCAANEACTDASPDLKTRFFDRIHSLRREPVFVNIPVQGGGSFPLKVDGDELLTDMTAVIDSTDANSLPALMDAAANGDLDVFYEFVFGQPLSGPQPFFPDPTFSDGKTTSYTCHDYTPFEPDAELVEPRTKCPSFEL